MTYRERGFVVLAGGASGLEVWSEVFKTEAEAVAAVERLGGHWSRQYMIVPALGLATNQKNA